jgi:selenocysteine lyase/cysteine desulfurase
VTPLPRSAFPVTERWTYLNHATICAPPRPAIDAAAAFNRDAAETGSAGFLDRVASVRPVREKVARLVGGDADGVAFTKNTTEALSIVANGMTWDRGDRVMLLAHDFVSTREPFIHLTRRGVELVELEPVDDAHRVPLDAFEAALAPGRVRLVVASWVQSNRGWRLDPSALAALCHRYDALLCLDVIQGLGVVPAAVESWGVDAVACGSHKWLLSPEGVGFLWLAPPLRTALSIPAPGWRWMGDEASEAAYLQELESTASRFEGGTLNGAGLAAMGAAIDMLAGAGMSHVWSYVSQLCDRVVAGLEGTGATVLSDRSPGASSAIVSFVPPSGAAADLSAALYEDGFATSARTGAVRVSPHAYNTVEEIDAFVAAVARRT